MLKNIIKNQQIFIHSLLGVIILSGNLIFAHTSHSAKRDIPRFMSIKTNEANARLGPGVNYQIKNIYKYKWLPVEVIAEYDTWKKIKDLEGDEGWMHTSILSNKRTVIIRSNRKQNLYNSDKLEKEKVIAVLMPNVVCALKKCTEQVCKISCKGNTGWINRKHLWGIYKKEKI